MTKKKTIITSIALLAAAGVIGVGGGLAVTSKPNEAAALDDTDQNGFKEISTGEELNQALSQLGADAAGKYELTNDIDLNGLELTKATGFQFTGELNGNGHTIYNAAFTSEGMIHDLGTNGYIHDFNLELKVPENGTANKAGIVYTNTSGKIENIKVVIDATEGTVSETAGLAFVSGNGDYINCHTYYLLSGSSSNWLGQITHQGETSGSLEGSTYSIDYIDSDRTDINNFRPGTNSVSEETTVGYAYAPNKNIELIAGEETTINFYGLAGSDSMQADYSVEEGKGITISNETVDGVTVTAAEAVSEPVELRVTYTDGESTATTTVNLTAIAASDVSAVDIAVPEGFTQLEVGEEVELSAVLTGTTYETIEWASSNEASLSINSADGLTATATAISVTDEPVVITVTVTVDENTAYEDNISIEIIEPTGFHVYMVMPDSCLSALSAEKYGFRVDQAWAGGSSSDFVYGTMHTIKNDGTQTKIAMGSDKASILDVFIPNRLMHIGETGYVPQGVYFARDEVTWGEFLTILSYDGSTGEFANAAAEIYQNEDGSWHSRTLTSQYAEAFTFLTENFNKVRTVGHGDGDVEYPDSICGLLDDINTVHAMIDDYLALSDDAKAVLDNVEDPIAAYPDSTVSDTVNMLMDEANYHGADSEGAFAVNVNDDGNLSAIIVLVTFGAAASLLTSYFIVKKKHQA